MIRGQLRFWTAFPSRKPKGWLSEFSVTYETSELSEEDVLDAFSRTLANLPTSLRVHEVIYLNCGSVLAEALVRHFPAPYRQASLARHGVNDPSFTLDFIGHMHTKQVRWDVRKAGKRIHQGTFRLIRGELVGQRLVASPARPVTAKVA